MVEDLREQMIQDEEPYEFEEEPRHSFQFMQGLEPWQRLLLAVLILLDVAVFGCVALVMMGRVSFPF